MPEISLKLVSLGIKTIDYIKTEHIVYINLDYEGEKE